MPRNIIVFLLFLSGVGLNAQKISGYVRDKENEEPVPFANVWVKGTIQGVQTDADGYFEISSPQSDTLCASSVGFIRDQHLIKKNVDQKVNMYLSKEVQLLKDVTVNAKMPITKVIFKRIQEHKKENSEQIYSVGDYKTLQNTTVYLAIDTTSRANRLFDNINETTIKMDDQELRFSPIYLYEKAANTSDFNDSVVYSKKDGIFPRLNQAIETYILRDMVVDLDFYKEQIIIMDRGFVSPISSSAMSYYNIYFNDSIKVDGKIHYHFSFAPKNRYNPLFSGNFVVEEDNYALTEIHVHIPKEANLNFINGFRGAVSYKKMDNGKWFYDGQQIDINMSLSLNKDTTVTYDSQRVNQIENGNWLISKSTIYANSAQLENVKASEWKYQPEFVASKLDEGIYKKVDNLKDNSFIKAVDAIGGMSLTSYFNLGKIDVGPVFDIYSTNTIEGTRWTIPLRTSQKMFENFYVGGFIGYGTRNKEFKYGTNVAIRPMDTDKFILRASYSEDYNLVSVDKFIRFVKNNPNTKGTSNFIAAVTAKEKNPYLKEETNIQMRVEYNGVNDFHAEASPYYQKSTRTPEVRFIKNGTEYIDYVNYGTLINFRFAFGQAYDLYFFDRVYYNTPKPILNLGFDFGETILPNGNVGDVGMYGQIHGSVQGRIVLGRVFLSYMLNAGYLWGDAPYDLLDQPAGSMSLGYAKYDFNLLHHASFAHNLYTNTHFHFNGGGIILNHIPLIQKLKLREVVSFKGHYGTLNNAYNGVFDLPDYYTNDFKSPYAEVGFGLTNILKILRVEYAFLLGDKYRNQSFTYNHGIFFRAEMSF